MQLSFVFQFYDVDGDGFVSGEDLVLILRQLVGASLSDEDVKALAQVRRNSCKLACLDFSGYMQS